MSVDMRDSWMTVAEAYPLLRQHFRAPKTLKHHLGRRERNGLTAADAVRLSPLGRLLVNPSRVVAWVLAETSGKAA